MDNNFANNNYFNGMMPPQQDPNANVFKAAAGETNNQYSNNTKKEEATPKTINIQPMEFPKVLEIAYTDTKTISSLINAFMREVFVDYYGTKIQVCANNAIVVTGYFMELGNNVDVPTGKERAVEQINTHIDKNDVNAKIKMFNRNATNVRPNYLKLTDIGKELITNIISPQRDNKGKIKWESITAEKSIITNDLYGSSKVVMTVTFDLLKIIKLLFGDKRNPASTNKKDGDKYNYMVTLGRPINTVLTATNQRTCQNWGLLIHRTNLQDVQAVAEQFGYVLGRNNNGINCD